MLRPDQLIECATLDLSLSPEMSDTLRGDTLYYVLAFEPGGKATMSPVGYEPLYLRWAIQRPTGTIAVFPRRSDVLSGESYRFPAFCGTLGLLWQVPGGPSGYICSNS